MGNKFAMRTVNCPQCPGSIRIPQTYSDVEIMRVFKQQHPRCYKLILAGWSTMLGKKGKKSGSASR